MFRVMELRDGKIELAEGSDRVAPPPPGVLRWIDLVGQDDAQLGVLGERFQFHPLTLEDCAHFDQRPKLEEHDGYMFLVTQGFHCQTEHVRELDLHELHTFLGDRYLVTVHTGNIGGLDEVWRRAAKDPKVLEKGVDFLYYLVADEMVDDNFPILDKVTDELDHLEDAVLSKPRRQDLNRIFELKHHLVTMRKVLSPQRDVLGVVSRHGQISERTAVYLRDVHDHLVRINESIETNRDLLGNALEAYLSAVGQRTNDIMKHLTIMSAVFLPLAFIVGFFGQNFDNLPFLKDWVHSDVPMWTMVVLCVATPVVMITWFKRRGWV
jgi:magnesium transporter